MFSHLTKKIVSIILICAFGVQLILPTEVFAIIPAITVSDDMMRSKEVGLTIFGVTIPGVTFDGIMILIVKKMLERMSDSTVAWINNGFNGKPAFAVDPGDFFLKIGDEIAGGYIQSIGAGALCSPFKAQIQAAVQLNYRIQREALRNGGRTPFGGTCTLSGTLGNIQDFFDGDFSQGGWEQFFSVTQNPNNNPYGAMLSAQAGLSLRINNVNLIESQKLSWGKGFLSTQDCLEYERVTDPNYNGPLNDSNGEPLTDLPTVNGACKKPGPIKTPGSIIENQLQNALGSEIRQLELADEFDEILSALVGQLLGTVFNQRGVINNETVGWAAGGYGGGSKITPGNYGCYPDKNSGDISSEYTWTVAGTPPGASYIWSGTDGLTGTTTSAKIKYAVGGIKSAEVIVSETVMDAGVETQKNTAVSCQPDIDVQKYPPITGFCYPIDTATYSPTLTLSEFRTRQLKRIRQSNNGQTPESVTWVLFPSGGSGTYDDFVWEANSVNIPRDLARDVRTVIEKIQTPLVGTGQDRHTIFTVGPYYKNTPNPRTTTVRIYDKEIADVEPATIQCATLDVI